MWAKRLGCGGETTKGENRGETTWGEKSWGRNDLLPSILGATCPGTRSCDQCTTKQNGDKNVTAISFWCFDYSYRFF